MVGFVILDLGIDVGVRGRRKRKWVIFDLFIFDLDMDIVIIFKKRMGLR